MSTSNTTTVELEEEALNIGIMSTGRDISARFGLDEVTVNAHLGQWDGQGPRYGMAPIPNHNHSETLASSRDVCGLQQAESSATPASWARSRVYGVAPLTVVVTDAPTTQQQTYFWGVRSSGRFFLSHGAAASTFVDGSGATNYVQKPAPYLNAAITNPRVTTSAQGRVQNYRQWSSLGLLTELPVLKDYVKFIAFAVTGRKFPQKYSLGKVYANGSGSTPPGVNFNATGYTKDFFNKSFAQTTQSFEVQTFRSDAWYLYTRYQYSSQILSTSYFTNTQTESDIVTTQMALPAATTATVGDVSLPAAYALFKAEGVSCVSEFYCFAAAPGKAIMAVFQDWVLGSYEVTTTLQGPSFQYVDPVRIFSKPPDFATKDLFSGSPSLYTEYGDAKNTCWYHWTLYNGTTPLAADPGIAAGARREKLYLGPANSGILRRNTTYEFAFSIFDKSTAHETNVGTPALILTGNDDFTKLLLYGYTTATADYPDTNCAGYASFPLKQVSIDGLTNDFVNRINMIQYRIYYRERGTFEWLPAAQIDAPSLYDITLRELWVCEGPLAASVGGQPGGFNDYSSLPDDTYFDTLQYRERLFWMSSKNLCYSRTQDVFSYPVTNAIACPDGTFKGMIVHAYPGQAQQDSRLIIFTTGQIAIGKFQGQEYATIQNVRVSSTASADLPVDGSDFTVNTWTTQTAFSARAAVIAQGILYYWGPTGIYRDLGAELPSKEWSELIEPYLFTLYDAERTDEIHSVYNDVTKEIVWFFPRSPKLGGGQGALSYKVTWGTFHPWDFGSTVVDAAQIVPANFDSTVSKGLAGSRIMLSIRDAAANTQRAVFFDDLCDSGDLTNNNTLLVKTVAVSGANRRLTFATRAATGTPDAIPTSGNLTLSSYGDYRDVLTPAPDAIYPIVGSDGSTYVDIGPVTGVAFPTTETISNTSRFFPVWIESLNGFTFSCRSIYWAPRGLRAWQRWLYCYQSIKLSELLPSTGQQMRLKVYSILGTGNSSRDITLVDNSRGNMQAHSQISFDQQNAEGPALSIELTTPSGKFCGSRWYCQYLSFDITPMPMNNFKTWEA